MSVMERKRIGTPWQDRYVVAKNGTVKQIRERTLTECINGHPLVGANVILRGGRPVCLTCERTRSREHKRRKHGHKPRVAKTIG